MTSTKASSGKRSPGTLLAQSRLADKVRIDEACETTDPDRTNPLARAYVEASDGTLFKWHHYFDIYHEHFNRFRQYPQPRVLEIGVGEGGSLGLWRTYFGDDAVIVGIDKRSNRRRFDDPGRRTHIRIGAQEDPEFLHAVLEEFEFFDIVIDDGGHRSDQQIASFLNLYPSLSLDGVYVVEDTHTSLWPAYQATADGCTFLALARHLVTHLYDPYVGTTDETPFRVGNPDKLRSVSVSRFYAETRSIAFYDSMIVFTRGERRFPRSERR